MTQNRYEPTWPFLCILVCLFVLSATSPSLWEKTAKQRANRQNDPQPSASDAQALSEPTLASGATSQSANSADTALRLAGNAPLPVVPAAPLAVPSDSTAAFTGVPGATVVSAEPAPRVANQPIASAQVEPAKTAPSASEPAKSVATQATLAKQEPVKSEPVKSEPPQTTLTASEPVKSEPTTSTGTTEVAMAPSRLSTGSASVLGDIREIESLLLPQNPLPMEPSDSLPEPSVSESAKSEPSASDRLSDAKQDRKASKSANSEPAAGSSDALASQASVAPPDALQQMLADLSAENETSDWADRTSRCLTQLSRMKHGDSQDAVLLATQLAALRGDAENLSARLGDVPLGSRVSRVGYALERRLSIWRHWLDAGKQVPANPRVAANSPRNLALCVNTIRGLTKGSAEGPTWNDYLALDTLTELSAKRRETLDANDRAVAKAVLQRITETPMSRGQRQFLAQSAFGRLRQELRHWAHEPITAQEVIEHAERYERTNAPSDGRLIAEDCRRLAASSDPREQALGRDLESYYRNANLRIVVAGELMNRMIPKRPPEYGCVNDIVLGTPVYGQSVTSTQIGIRLIPDSHRLRVALEINGLVSALTESSSGPALFYTDSHSTYRAWKEVEVSQAGLKLKPAEVAVSNDTKLRGLETDFDVIPLVGSLVQEVARSQHEARRDEVRTEVAEKVSSRARAQIDTETEARLKTLATRFQDRVLAPIADLALGPDIVSAETTERRIALRLRLASEGQLGSHTPRPRAPGDSLASVQIHETALNNVVQQTQLDGNTFTLPELRQRIALRFNRPELLRGVTEHDDISIRFAPKDAVCVQCQRGQVVITLAIASLTRQSQTWNDFRVRACYRPEVSGRRVMLIREDVVQLIGAGLGTRTQIPLRSIFGKVFSKDQPFQMIPETIANDNRIAGLVISQFTLEDGWMALALSPERADRAQSVMRQQDHLTR
jgi:hypothetical protein